MATRIIRQEDSLRQFVESYVRKSYQTAHGAIIKSFPETMIASFDETGRIRAAAGLRLNRDGFFSESYLDEPLEDVLSTLAKECVGRQRIIEVTNLASSGVRVLSGLISEITLFARGNGADWAIFTITQRLKKLLEHMDLPITELGAADASRVSTPEDWGTYYETGPVVTAMRDSRPLPVRRLGLPASPPIADMARVDRVPVHC